MDCNAVLMRCFPNGSFRKVFMLKLPHHVVAVFCAPFKVPRSSNRLYGCNALTLCLSFSRPPRTRAYAKWFVNDAQFRPQFYTAAKPHKNLKNNLKVGELNPKKY